MTDAQTLFRQGILAVREKNTAEGRKLLTESLRLDPNNEMGWLWLARTVSKAEIQLQCLDRALRLNPANEAAQAMRRQILSEINHQENPPPAETPETEEAAVPLEPPKPKRKPPTVAQQRQIQDWLDGAEKLIEQEDGDGAIDKWMRVLEIVPDHAIALPNAVRYLSRLKYIDDARDLVWDAINIGTTVPAIYLTAIDIARYQKNDYEVNDLRERLAALPTATEDMISELADYYRGIDSHRHAETILLNGIESHPESQKLLVRMGDLLTAWERTKEAQSYYERAARLGLRTKEGKIADQKLLATAPLLTDKERGSMVLVWREVAGVGVAYLLLGWQDAGLNLILMGGARWAGVLLSIVGAYLTITATSSPQQRPLGKWFKGELPEKPKRKRDDVPSEAGGPIPAASELPIIPTSIRLVLGSVGIVILLVAFWLVFSQAISLLVNPVPPCVPTIEQLINGEAHGC
jgi:tetratricopeptide (TPR) repeat protein